MRSAAVPAPAIIRFSAWMLIGLVIILSLQPSLAIAKSLASWVDLGILEYLFGWVPFFGKFFLWAIGILTRTIDGVPGLAYLIAIVDFLFTQYLELDWFFGTPTPASKRLRFIAYAKEFVQAGIISPPYQGGWDAILNDMPIWNASLIDWTGLAIFALLILAPEASIKFLLPYLKKD
jgi:hypothetical protein